MFYYSVTPLAKCFKVLSNICAAKTALSFVVQIHTKPICPNLFCTIIAPSTLGINDLQFNLVEVRLSRFGFGTLHPQSRSFHGLHISGKV